MLNIVAHPSNVGVENGGIYTTLSFCSQKQIAAVV